MTSEHALQTILDAAALLPVVGGLKYTDEAGDLLKNAVKHGDLIATRQKLTTKEVTQATKKLGYEPTGQFSHGQPIFKKGNRYITSDVDSHNEIPLTK